MVGLSTKAERETQVCEDIVCTHRTGNIPLTRIVAVEVGEEEYWVKYGVYKVPTEHWYIMLLSCELRVEKVSVVE